MVLSKYTYFRKLLVKNQSRQITSTLVKAEILTVEYVQGAADYLKWITKSSTRKSTNCIDDILVLTSKGSELLSQINLGIEKDRQCWYWVNYCSGDGQTC